MKFLNQSFLFIFLISISGIIDANGINAKNDDQDKIRFESIKKTESEMKKRYKFLDDKKLLEKVSAVWNFFQYDITFLEQSYWSYNNSLNQANDYVLQSTLPENHENLWKLQLEMSNLVAKWLFKIDNLKTLMTYWQYELDGLSNIYYNNRKIITLKQSDFIFIKNYFQKETEDSMKKINDHLKELKDEILVKIQDVVEKSTSVVIHYKTYIDESAVKNSIKFINYVINFHDAYFRRKIIFI